MKLTRRAFVQVITISAGLVEGCGSSSSKNVTVVDGSRFFPQSVASGDPRDSSVVLWTRLADEQGPINASLTLEVSTDVGFNTLVSRTETLQVAAEHDGALKVKLAGLQPRTTYYYRFVYQREGQFYASRTGQTRTAPLPSDDVPVRFAVTTCQDFVGRYYNSWQRLVDVDEDLDFVLFLGDYVYETTGDPGFMSNGESGRAVTFNDVAGSLSLGDASAPFYAAQSLSNYRDLYKTVRSDPFLRAAHERYPFVFIWDDHEYSDDAHGSTSTYTDGRQPEQNDDRKRNAERAYFEYVPLDHPDQPDGEVNDDALPVYPATHIYRDLGFGKNLRLVVADCRTYRADHLIPEQGYPAAVVVTQDELVALGVAEAFAGEAFAYVDIDAADYANARVALIVACEQLAEAAGLSRAAATTHAQTVVHGPLALAYVNAVLTNPSVDLAAIPADGLPRGLAWVHMGKRDLFSSQGARYVVVKDTLDVYSAVQYAKTQGQSESTFGDAQSAWLDRTLAAAETWKVLVSSFSITSMIIDLRDASDVTDVSLRNRYYLNADQWNGFPKGRANLLTKLGTLSQQGALVVSGDIHASFASVEAQVPCLTTPAISSGSIQAGARAVALGAGFSEDSAIFRHVVTDIEQTLTAGNPGIAFTDTDSHGFMVVELSAAGALVTFHLIPSSEVHTSYAGRSTELAARFATKTL